MYFRLNPVHYFADTLYRRFRVYVYDAGHSHLKGAKVMRQGPVNTWYINVK